MKTVDVQIGETYLTRIGRDLCKVVVMYETHNYKRQIRFVVRRASEPHGGTLRKARSAAALRPVESTNE